MEPPVELSGYFPGALGAVTELHGRYYHRHWGFDVFFEAKVATELAEFLGRLNPRRDGFWVARIGGRTAGSIAIDGAQAAEAGARLRWFILDEEWRGRGVGKRLLAEAMGFCRQAGFRRVTLWTFAGLDAARHLYEQHGFRLREEHPDTQWGKTVTEQRFEWTPDADSPRTPPNSRARPPALGDER